ncbi:MAG: transcriptional repressor [Chitinophagales bacterium]|nr:transcriptional repressor [Chitinophagales bacterium]
MVSTTQILKDHKLRVTPFRIEVLELFSGAQHALAAADLETLLNNPDRITLYRTLKSFEEKGIIHKAIDGTNQPKFALCEAHCHEHNHHDEHVHFHCIKCENTFCIESVFIPEVSLPQGFRIKQTDMIVSGECEQCVMKEL